MGHLATLRARRRAEVLRTLAAMAAVALVVYLIAGHGVEVLQCVIAG